LIVIIYHTNVGKGKRKSAKNVVVPMSHILVVKNVLKITIIVSSVDPL